MIASRVISIRQDASQISSEVCEPHELAERRDVVQKNFGMFGKSKATSSNELNTIITTMIKMIIQIASFRRRLSSRFTNLQDDLLFFRCQISTVIWCH